MVLFRIVSWPASICTAMVVRQIPILSLIFYLTRLRSRLTGCSFQFMFGKLYSVFSVKTIFLASVAIFEIGSLVSGTASISDALILGRAISGVGSAGIIAGCFT